MIRQGRICLGIKLETSQIQEGEKALTAQK